MAESQELVGIVPLTAFKANILLVDDNPANLLALRAILDDLGHDLIEARSGEEALRQVQSEEFALVLLDVLMPGISGFETAKLLRGEVRSRHTPIIFITANDIDHPLLEEAYSLGAVDFLVKPLSQVVLQAKVRGFIDLFREKQRARSEADQLRLLVEGAEDYAIFLLDLQGNVASWNAGAQRIKGYRAEEIIGRHFSQFYPQDAIDRGWPDQELRAALKEGRFEDEGWRVRKDGGKFFANVVITALRDAGGNLRGFSKITRDVTERKRAEENERLLAAEAAARQAAEEYARLIQEQRERLRVTLASIGDAVISTDAEGRIAFLNPVAESLVGWKNEEAAHRSLSDVFRIMNEATRRPVENPAIRAIREGMIVGLANHTILISKDGTERPIDDSAAPVRDADGLVIGSVLVFRDVTERRRSERELADFFENATVGLHWVGPDGIILRVNQAELDMLGYRRDEYVGRPISDFHADEDVICDILRRLRAGEKLAEYSARLRCKDGSIKDVLIDSSMMFRDGELVHTRCFTRDVTERKRALDALRDSEQRFARFMQHLPGLAWIKDIEGRYVYANDAAEKAFRKSRPELYGKTDDDIFPPETAAQFRRNDQQAISSGVGVQVVEALEQADGLRYSLVTKFPILGSHGQISLVGGMAIDVTEQRRVEQALNESVRLYRAIGESIDYGVWVCDSQGRNIYASESFLRLVGLTQEQCSLFGWGEVLHPEDAEKNIAAWKECVQTGGQWDVEHRFRGVDGRWHPILARGVPVKNDRDEITAWAGINLDISRLKQVEEKLRETDRRKDEFLAMLAHELRNPLAPIRNALEILKMPRVDVETAERSRKMMERQVHHLMRLVDDLLDVSRVMRGKIELRRESVEFATVVARAVETAQPLIDAQGHELSVRISPESLLLDADPVRLTQVVGNLLTNAAKYTEHGGRIWLTAERNGDMAMLRVRDNGIGIDPAMLPHIFDVFVQVDHSVTRSQGGLGIGLTLVRNLVEMHNGTVEARSNGLGAGSEFIVQLPILAPALDDDYGAKTGRSKSQFPHPSGKRLLVVDDNQDAATSLALLLQLHGHEVRVAHSGFAALEMTKTYSPDVVFLDIGMPGMDGYEVARRMRQQPDLERVVLAAVTGWGQHEDRRRTAEAGFNHHLVKPPEPEALENLLASLPAHRSNPK